MQITQCYGMWHKIIKCRIRTRQMVVLKGIIIKINIEVTSLMGTKVNMTVWQYEGMNMTPGQSSYLVFLLLSPWLPRQHVLRSTVVALELVPEGPRWCCSGSSMAGLQAFQGVVSPPGSLRHLMCFRILQVPSSYCKCWAPHSQYIVEAAAGQHRSHYIGGT